MVVRRCLAGISLQARVISILILLIACVDYAAISAIGGWFSAKEKRFLEEHLDLLLKVQGLSLITPLWEVDLDEVHRLVALVGKDELVSHVIVREGYAPKDEQPKLLAEYGSAPINDPFAATGNFWITEPESGERIGLLSLSLSGHHVAASLLEIEFALLCTGLIALVILAGIAISCIEMLMRPLRRMTTIMHSLAQNNLAAIIPALNRPDEIGAMARSIQVFKDNAIKVTSLTEQLRGQAVELRASLEKERELSAIQRQFVSTVSHEFRTPLAIIDASAQYLLRREGDVSPDRLRSCLQKITESVKGLTELMESMLSVAQLEAGSIAMSLGSCKIAKLITECCQSQREIGSSHVIEENLEQLPADIVADSKLLNHVITNLLSNAVKFSPCGEPVSVEGWCDGDKAVIAVRDQGVGIPKEQLQNIFGRFFRASTAENIPGTGIGLNLVLHLVQLHGGTITVDSDEGTGSTFTVRLPINGPPCIKELPTEQRFFLEPA